MSRDFCETGENLVPGRLRTVPSDENLAATLGITERSEWERLVEADRRVYGNEPWFRELDNQLIASKHPLGANLRRRAWWARAA